MTEMLEASLKEGPVPEGAQGGSAEEDFVEGGGQVGRPAKGCCSPMGIRITPEAPIYHHTSSCLWGAEMTETPKQRGELLHGPDQPTWDRPRRGTALEVWENPALWWEVKGEGSGRPRPMRLEEATVPVLWEAVMKAAKRAGEEDRLPRYIASVLSQDIQAKVPLELEGSGRFHALVVRIPRARCPVNPEECLLSLMVEALASRQRHKPLVVARCRYREEGVCQVILAPLVREVREIPLPL